MEYFSRAIILTGYYGNMLRFMILYQKPYLERLFPLLLPNTEKGYVLILILPEIYSLDNLLYSYDDFKPENGMQ